MNTDRTAGTGRYAAGWLHLSFRGVSWLSGSCIALVALVCMVAGAASYSFVAPDEARHAGIVHDMWAARHFLMPRVNGFPTLDGAPLHYWVSLLFVSLFGAHEWVLRLPSALAATALLVLIGKAFLPFPGRGMAVVLTLLFLLQPALQLGARFASPDMLSLLLLAASLGGFLNASQKLEQGRGPTAGLWGAWVATALLGLSAGALATLLPLLVVALWLLLRRRFDTLAALRWGAGVLIIALLLLPWWWLAERNYPGIALAMLQKQATSLLNHGRHGWLELGHDFCRLLMLLGALPLLACVARYLRPGRKALLHTPAAGLMLVWLLVITPLHSVMVVSPVGHAVALVVPLLYFSVLVMAPQDKVSFRMEAAAWLAPVSLALVLGSLSVNFLSQRLSGMQPVTRFLKLHYNSLTDKAIMLDRYDYDFNFHMRSPKLVYVATDWRETGLTPQPFWKQAFRESAGFVPDTAARMMLGTFEGTAFPLSGQSEPAQTDQDAGGADRLLERVCRRRAVNLWVLGAKNAAERYAVLRDFSTFTDVGELRIWYMRAGRDPMQCVAWALTNEDGH